jgi:hypothetical protein
MRNLWAFLRGVPHVQDDDLTGLTVDRIENYERIADD